MSWQIVNGELRVPRCGDALYSTREAAAAAMLDALVTLLPRSACEVWFRVPPEVAYNDDFAAMERGWYGYARIIRTVPHPEIERATIPTLTDPVPRGHAG